MVVSAGLLEAHGESDPAGDAELERPFGRAHLFNFFKELKYVLAF